MRPMLRLMHRYLSLACAALWLMQAVTGALLVFHWELDDWPVRGAAGPLNPLAFSHAVLTYDASHPGRRIRSAYASGGAPGRFDLLVDSPGGKTDVLRVDGSGIVLRARPWDHDYAHIGVFQDITVLHQTLFAGDLGKWFLGVSGVLLATNLLMGLTLAWPRIGGWRRALIPASSQAPAMGLFAWHRASGLWLGLIALITVGAGITMAFEDPLGDLIGDPRVPPDLAAASAIPRRAAPVTPAEAIAAAFSRYPGAPLDSLTMPAPGQPWYRVRVRHQGEARRIDGQTTVYVSDRDGRVLADYDALRAPIANRAFDSLYAVHTGEIGGTFGRWMAVAVGVWLSAMITLGILLWTARRRLRRHSDRARNRTSS